MVNTVLEAKANSGRGVKRFAAMFTEQTKAHALLILLCMLFFVTSLATSIAFDRDIGTTAMPYLSLVFGFILPIAFAGSLIGVFLYILLIKRPASPTQAMIEFYRPLLLNPRRYANALPVIGCMLLGFVAFADMKPLIPIINPFSWDERFMRLDRLLHFGTDPWRLLDPILGHPIITQWINYAYNIWFIVMFSFWVGAAWSARNYTSDMTKTRWERQFLVSFILCWIVGGMILAILFSSMGPAFYDLVDAANNPYAAQMAGLGAIHETHPLWAIDSQNMLRSAYLNPAPGQLSGISAMPSIHNATSTLFMLAAYRINKIFGHVMLAFLFCIILGSVHLAWHYAVDAYLGIIIAVILWKLSSLLIKWQDRLLKLKIITKTA